MMTRDEILRAANLAQHEGRVDDATLWMSILAAAYEIRNYDSYALLQGEPKSWLKDTA